MNRPLFPSGLIWLLICCCLALLPGCATSKKQNTVSAKQLALIQKHQWTIHDASRAFWSGKAPILTLPFGKLWAEKKEGGVYSGHVFYKHTGELGPQEVSAESATVKEGELQLDQLHVVGFTEDHHGYPSTLEATAMIVRESGMSVIGPLNYVGDAPKP